MKNNFRLKGSVSMQVKKIQLNDSSFLEAYIADKTLEYTRKAILIIPGGAYQMICSDREGEPIALGFMPYGFNAFVLHYSVDGKKAFPSQLIEASLAMKYIRDNADELGIDSRDIYVAGFSAGGHLAACLGTMWDNEEIYSQINMPKGYNKPKGMILIYPVISGISDHSHKNSFENLLLTPNPDEDMLKKCSIEFNVSPSSCPAFILHTVTDELVPVQNSLILADAYSKLSLPYELHIYPNGVHGFSLGNKITWQGEDERIINDNFDWIKMAVNWANNL